jgi:hypothetical protein
MFFDNLLLLSINNELKLKEHKKRLPLKNLEAAFYIKI